MQKIKICDNINLNYIQETKFKTTTIGTYIHRPLNAKDATKNALIPYMLRRGCAKYPSTRLLEEHLDDLYGAKMYHSVEKKGEDQILGISFKIVSDKYLPDNVSITDSITDLMLSVVFEPLLENNSFNTSYFEQEKKTIKEEIENLINDKRDYAVWRCFEEMCKNEAYGVYKLGSIEQLDKITPQELYSHYKDIISSSFIDIFICGEVDFDAVCNKIRQFVSGMKFNAVQYPETAFNPAGDVKHFEDIMDVNQGKLSLGFRTNIKPTDSDYYALVVFNSIFGGGAHSKLFNNVREKLSLAYYVFSRLEKYKGLMIVSSGIEFANYQKAYDEIFVQLDAVKSGDISDNELFVAKSALINTVESYKDEQGYLRNFYLSELVANTNNTIDGYIEKIKAVTINDVIKAANKIVLDTEYFLKGTEA